MAWQPNIKNRATLRRIQIAVDFVTQYLSRDKARACSQSQIDKYFTHSRNPINQWLRRELLICVDPYYNYTTHKCKRYLLNPNGVELCQTLIGSQPTTLQITSRQAEELATGEFHYQDKSHRYYNSLQNLKRELRIPLLARHGYNYHYDIKCAAPTLVRQYAEQCGLTEPTPALDAYIHQRAEIRQRLAQELDLAEDTVKRIINSILHGGCISTSYQSSVWQLCEQERARILWLKQDPYVQELKRDIQACWRKIKPHLQITGRISGRHKSQVYRRLERQVMDEVYKFLRKDKNKFFKEHDGFTCEYVIEQERLRSWVYKTTGYVIDFDYTHYVRVPVRESADTDSSLQKELRLSLGLAKQPLTIIHT